MRGVRIWAGLFGVEDTVVERVAFDEVEDALVVAVRPRSCRRGR